MLLSDTSLVNQHLNDVWTLSDDFEVGFITEYWSYVTEGPTLLPALSYKKPWFIAKVLLFRVFRYWPFPASVTPAKTGQFLLDLLYPLLSKQAHSTVHGAPGQFRSLLSWVPRRSACRRCGAPAYMFTSSGLFTDVQHFARWVTHEKDICIQVLFLIWYLLRKFCILLTTIGSFMGQIIDFA